jgi:D-beta-D-heptose 7-phosphate kinase/D-beta-D-heptose 1-phosphate adenosyltransferase
MTLAASVALERAHALISRFAGTPVLVIGDLMLDRFINGRVTRISPEAPVPVVRFESEHVRLGGAANVAHNLATLGGRVTLVGVVGADPAGGRLRAELTKAGIDCGALVEDPSRPTVEKVRIVTERNQQVARIDYEHDDEVGREVEARILDRIGAGAASARAILVSDYLKGAITNQVMKAAVACRTRMPVLVDPKIPHLESYAGATLITPNQHEAESATHRRIRNDTDAWQAALEFRARAKCDAVLVTRGEQGMWLSSSEAEGAIPASAREVSDVTGAGDTVIATLAVSLAAGATLLEAAVLANHAAAVVVGKFGPAAVSRAELMETIQTS